MGSKLIYSLPALFLALLALILAIVGLTYESEPDEAAAAQAHAVKAAESAQHYSYWVVTQPMKAGDKLDAAKLAKISSPTAIANVISAKQNVAGKVLERAVQPGELISTAAFEEDQHVLASVLPSGRRALAIPVSDVSGVGGLLRPGDTVDVITAFSQSDDKKGAAALVILHAIPVLALHGYLTPPSSGDKDKERRHNNTVVLSVPMDKVTALMLASTKGKIRLAMVSAKDVAEPQGAEETLAAQTADETSQPEAQKVNRVVASAATSQVNSQKSNNAEQKNKPFYYSDFFPEAKKTPVKKATHRPRGHRVEVFEGASTRSTYVQ